MTKTRDIPSMIDSMTLEKVQVSSLVPWEGNPRNHNEDIDHLCRSIGYYGWTVPILAQRGTNRVIAGHGRLEAAVRKGLEIIPVIFLDYDDQDASAYTVADNALAEKSSWDVSKLKGLLDELTIDGFDLSTSVLDDLSFEALSTRSTLSSVTKLKPHPLDYRVHTEEELDHVARNIEKHGFYKDVVTSSDGTVLAGQEILQAAERAGMKEVPVKRLDIDKSDPEALKLLVADREIGNLTDVDDRKLTNLLVEIDKKDDLTGTGFDKPMVAALLLNTRTEAEVKDVNAAAEWVGMPEYEPAPDTYKLVVNFRNAEDRDRFVEQTGLAMSDRNRNTASCWWPEKEREDIASVKWETE